jgi:hypothetical protein
MPRNDSRGAEKVSLLVALVFICSISGMRGDPMAALSPPVAKQQHGDNLVNSLIAHLPLN